MTSWRRSDIFFVNFGQISYNVDVSILNFEQVNAGWVERRYLRKTKIKNIHNLDKYSY